MQERSQDNKPSSLMERIKVEIEKYVKKSPSVVPVFTTNNNFKGVLISGDEIFGKQAELIKAAKSEILLQTFAWEAHSPGAKMILLALHELHQSHQQKQKVQKEQCRPVDPPITLCVLINNSIGLAKRFMKSTSQNNRVVEHKDELKRAKNDFGIGIHFEVDPSVLLISAKSYNSSGLASMHGKVLIVDNSEIVITGANHQARNHGDEACFDMGFAVQGGVAISLRQSFMISWNAESAKLYRGSDIKPQPNVEFKIHTSTPFLPIIVAGRSSSNIATTQCTQNIGFLSAFRNAKYSINLMYPNLNATFILDEIIAAVRRNVKVKLILSKNFNDAREQGFFAGGTNQDIVRKLYKSVGNDNKNLDIRWYSDSTGKVVIGNSPRSSHAKFATFDNCLAIVGSANLDKHATQYAFEVNIIIDSYAVVRKMNTDIYNLIFCRCVSVFEYANRASQSIPELTQMVEDDKAVNSKHSLVK